MSSRNVNPLRGLSIESLIRQGLIMEDEELLFPRKRESRDNPIDSCFRRNRHELRKLSGLTKEHENNHCPSFPQSVERESRAFSQGTGFRLTTCRNDIFKGNFRVNDNPGRVFSIDLHFVFLLHIPVLNISIFAVSTFSSVSAITHDIKVTVYAWRYV